MRTKLPIAILISRRGSNMEALLNACDAPDYPAKLVAVLSNNPDAAGLDIARAKGIPAHAIDHRPFGQDREGHERAMDEKLRQAGARIICLAGYMRVLTPFFVEAWSERMLNIHPSLLPKYPGLHTHQRALDAGDTVHGATVHLVTPGVDEGPVIAQARINIRPDDTAETLSRRLLPKEHALYQDALRQFITNQASGL